APKRNPLESGVVLEPVRAAAEDELDALLDVSLDDVLIEEDQEGSMPTDPVCSVASSSGEPPAESQRAQLDARVAELETQRAALEAEVQQLKHQVSAGQQEVRNKAVAAETALETCDML